MAFALNGIVFFFAGASAVNFLVRWADKAWIWFNPGFGLVTERIRGLLPTCGQHVWGHVRLFRAKPGCDRGSTSGFTEACGQMALWPCKCPPLTPGCAWPQGGGACG